MAADCARAQPFSELLQNIVGCFAASTLARLEVVRDVVMKRRDATSS